tara:strand:+ start:1026 stop:6542 length:5517 start_codon:yes stop_codon:yes gene_type:complete
VVEDDLELYQKEQEKEQEQTEFALNTSEFKAPPKNNPSLWSTIKDDPGAVLRAFTPGYMSGQSASAEQGTDPFSVSELFSSLGPAAYETGYYMPVLGTIMGAQDSYNMLTAGGDVLAQTLGALGFLGFAETAAILGAGTSIAAAGRFNSRRVSANLDNVSSHGPHKQTWEDATTYQTGLQELLDGMPLVISSGRENMLTELAGFPDTGAKRYTMYALMDQQSQDIQQIVRFIPLADEPSISQGALFDEHLEMAFILSKDQSLDEGATNFAVFLMGLGEMLYERAGLFHDLSTVDPMQIKTALAATAINKWNYLMKHNRLTLEGPFEGVDDIWKAFTELGKFDDADAERLMPAIKAFTEVTKDIGHPELVMMNDPRLKIDHITLTKQFEDPVGLVRLAINRFEEIDPRALSAYEMNERVRLMFRHNPEAMTHLATENILDFFFDEVLPNWDTLTTQMGGKLPGTQIPGEQHGRNWYNLALKDIQDMALKHGVDEDLSVGIAALLSATTSWEMNLDNVGSILSWMKDWDGINVMLARAPDGEYKLKTKNIDVTDPESLVHQITTNLWGNQQGLYMSNDQAESIRSLVQFVQDGGTVSDWFENLMTKGKNLKVPNFWAAIAKSDPSDVAARRTILYRILTGEITLKDLDRPIFSESAAALELSKAFKTFPMTVDRHAYAIALGYSTKPFTDATMQAAYDPIKLAYLAAAELIGEIQFGGPRKPSPRMQVRRSFAAGRGNIAAEDGYTILDPNDLQAMTWLRWREVRDVTRGMEEVSNLGISNPTLHAEGVGPIHVHTDRILNFVTGKLPEGVDLGGPRINATGQTVPLDKFGRTLGTGAVTKQGVLKATQSGYANGYIEITPSGPRWVTDAETGPNQWTFPTQATNADGLAIHMGRQAKPVDSVDDQLRRINDSTFIKTEAGREPALTGGSVYPPGAYIAGNNLGAQGLTGLHTKGHHIVLSVPNVVRNMAGMHDVMAEVAGLQHHFAMKATMSYIKGHLNGQFDVNPEFLLNKPHTGKSSVIRHPDIKNYDGSPMDFWSFKAVEDEIASSRKHAGLDPLKAERIPDLNEEPRIELIISFNSAEDLRHAHSILTSPLGGYKSNSFDGINVPYVSQSIAGYTSSTRKSVSGRELNLAPQKLLRSQKTLYHYDNELELDAGVYEQVGKFYDDFDAVPTKMELELLAKHGGAEEVAKYGPVLKAWQAFEDEIKTQFIYMTEVMGIRVEVVDVDPYANPMEMITDVLENSRIKVLSSESTGGHPYLTNQVNDMFRAIHDVFGHASEGMNFSRTGEFFAATKHMMMFSEEARPAMLFDTLGQNASMVRAGGQFPEQKIGILPKGFWPDAPIWGKKGSPFADRPTDHRVIDYGNSEQVMDYKIITDVNELPSDVAKVKEHYYVDDSGSTLVHLSKQGRDTDINTRTVGVLRGDHNMESFLEGETAMYTAGDAPDRARAVGDKGTTQFQRRASRGEQGVATQIVGNTRYSGGTEMVWGNEVVPVRMVPIDELYALDDWSYNMNRRDQAGFEELKADIEKNGFVSPIQVMLHPEVGNAVAIVAQGNHRLAAARELGLSHVPVVGRWDHKGELAFEGYTPHNQGETGAVKIVDKTNQQMEALQAKYQNVTGTTPSEYYFDIKDLFKTDDPKIEKTVLSDPERMAVSTDDMGLQPAPFAWVPFHGLEEGPRGLTWGGQILIQSDVRPVAKGDLAEPGHIFGVEVATGDVYKSGANKGQPKYEKPTSVVMYVPEDPTQMPVIMYNVDSIEGAPLERQIVLQTSRAKKKGDMEPTVISQEAAIDNLVMKPLSTQGQDGRTRAAKEASIELITRAAETLKSSGLVYGEIGVRQA